MDDTGLCGAGSKIRLIAGLISHTGGADWYHPCTQAGDGGTWHIIDPDGREVDTALCVPHVRALEEMLATLHGGWFWAWPIQPTTSV